MIGFNKSKTLQARLDLAESDLDLAHKENTDLRMEIKDLQSTISGFVAIKSDYENKISKNNELSSAKDDIHQIELKTLNNSVNAKIASALASIGVNNFLDEPICASNNDKLSPLEHFDKFNNLPKQEKTAYYNLHKDAINQALRVR